MEEGRKGEAVISYQCACIQGGGGKKGKGWERVHYATSSIMLYIYLAVVTSITAGY